MKKMESFTQKVLKREIKMTKKIKRPLTRIEMLKFPEMGSVPYVRQFLSDKGFKINPDSSISNARGILVPADHLFADLHDTHSGDLHAYIKAMEKGDYRPSRLSDKSLEAALRLIIDSAREDDLLGVKESTKFDPSNSSDLMGVFVKAVTGTDSPMVVGALKHWIKNIKRRMAGKEVAYHLFPVIVGKQQGGKTTAFKMLVSPISWYVMSLNSIAALADEKNYKSLSERFVCIIDEMARTDTTDANVLKYIITADKITARVMYTNIRATYRANASYVGTANQSVPNLIYDPTGMRRWLEVKAMNVLDWNVINTLDYVALWKSIDEEVDYLAPIRVELEAHQEQMRHKSPVEEFVEDMGIVPGQEGTPEHRITNGCLFGNYLSWASKVGKRQLLDTRSLGRQLEDLGFIGWRVGVARGRWVKPPTVFEKKGNGTSWAEDGLANLESTNAPQEPEWQPFPSVYKGNK